MTSISVRVFETVYNKLNNEETQQEPEENTTMQQAFYNSISIQNNSGVQAGSPAADTDAARTASVLRWVARKWDLVGVLALMGASAAYGVFALMHLGL